MKPKANFKGTVYCEIIKEDNFVSLLQQHIADFLGYICGLKVNYTHVRLKLSQTTKPYA